MSVLNQNTLFTQRIFFFFFDKCFLLAEMTTKFNKDMYARMRGKKDEPLSALGTNSVRITDRGVPILAALPSLPLRLQR